MDIHFRKMKMGLNLRFVFLGHLSRLGTLLMVIVYHSQLYPQNLVDD